MKIRTVKARIYLVAIIFVAMFFIIAGNITPSYALDGLNVTPHTKSEVVQKLKSSGVSVKDNHSFATTPAKNNTPGDLTSASKQSALKMLNNIRFLAGVPDVSLDNTLGQKAQAAAFVNWCIDDLTHHPKTDASKPEGMSDALWNLGEEGASSSNIAWGHQNLNSAVLDWMADEDASNISRLGHRRWAINPKMGKIGFGASAPADQPYYEKYYAEYSFDNSGSGTQTNVAWPASYMPIEYFSNVIPWSLSTGKTVNRSNVTVNLTRRAESPSGAGTWTFRGSESYTAANTGKYFNVDNGGYGQIGCIIFRPDNINYEVGDIFDVSITGAGSDISYTVEFICGYPVETVTFSENEYTLTSSSINIRPNITPATASEYEVTYASSDESVVTVNEYGTITKVGIGVATVTATIDGRYTSTGKPLSASYTVKVPKNITSSDISINYNTQVYYSGERADIGLEIKDGDKTLVENEDYTVSIYNDEEAIKPKWKDGSLYSYIAVINGIEDYYGNTYKNFFIRPKSLYDCRMVISPESAEYKGTNQKPNKISVYNGNLQLVEGIDYYIDSNEGGTNAGSYSVRLRALDTSECYTGYALGTFTITKKTITADMIDAISAVTYNGSAQTPNITVKHGSRTMVKNTDYTVTYSDNTDAGTATATITGKGNYEGSVNKEFTINPKPLTGSIMTLSPSSAVYNAQNQKPTVTVKDGSIILTSGTDYTLTNNGRTDVGSCEVVATGKGNYTGEIKESFSVTPAIIEGDMITLSENSFTYNGEAKAPTVTVKYENRTLTEDTDYTVSYSNNTDAGKATVTITGKNNFTGVVYKEFEIEPKTITDEMVELSSRNFTYNGGSQTPTVAVKDGSKTLADNTDYTISYSNNTNAGTATATITGTRNYAGTVSRNFTISPKAIKDEMIELSATSFTYSGERQLPDVTVKDGDSVLRAGTDFSIECTNNINAGTATATITGRGNYDESREVNFKILAMNIGSSEIQEEHVDDWVLEGNQPLPEPILTFNGTQLTKDDYDLGYGDTSKEGTVYITVSGKGNFTQSREVSFKVISRARAELNDLIKDLERDLQNETDGEFKAAIEEALRQARVAADDFDKTPAELMEVLSAVKSLRQEATIALEEKKEAERIAAEEAAAAKLKAEEEAKKIAAARAAQKGADGTSLGAGASAENAENAILSSTSDEGPKGSKFAPLTLKSTKQSKTSIKLTWTKVKGAKKYVVYGNMCNAKGKKYKMVRLATTTGKNSYNVKKISKALKKGTYHKFMVVALDANNNVITSSKVIHVATKGNKKIANPTDIKFKAPKTLKKGKTHKLAAKQIGKNVKKHRVLAYESTNTKVATVSKKGVIKAKGKGTCYIHIYAQNGLFKKVKVKVN